MRCALLTSLKPDILSVNETHLTRENTLSLSNYVWFGFNRKFTHVRAPKGSGGVGLFINERLLQIFNVEIISKSVDGVLAILFTCIYNSLQFIVISCYLPPENSVWGRDAEQFYSALLHIIFTVHVENIIICGDLNSRIGNLNDVVFNPENLPKREFIDHHINQHGRSLIEFLHGAGFCVINGRINPEINSFACMTSRDSSCVDYIIVPQHLFALFKNFNIITCNEIIEDYNLFHLVSDRSKIPDHCVLCINLNITCLYNSEGVLSNDGIIKDRYIYRKKYYCREIPDIFMNNIDVNCKINCLQNAMENVTDTVTQINLFTEEMNLIILSEMDTI